VVPGWLLRARRTTISFRTRELKEQSMTNTTTFHAPRGDAEHARLELSRGGSNIEIRSAEIEELASAMFRGVKPKATSGPGFVTIEYPRFSVAELIRHPAHRADVELNSGLSWSLHLRGGLADSNLDLRGLELRSLDLDGGAANVLILLGKPHGRVRVRIGSGVSKVTVLHPAETAMTLRVTGGASKLEFDGQRFGALGGETIHRTRGDDADRYELEILGGASRLTITESEEADRFAGAALDTTPAA
jgi:hypothetical protein